ncbi:MAG: hypothetical protein ACI837_001864 [Crocinitomicaceae bacterium]|jgi:hypothetical protein
MTKRLHSTLIFTAFIACTFLFNSCSKVEGPGGSSTIKGVIHIVVKDIAGNVINQYDAPKTDVYLIYGDTDTYYDDDVETSHDGTFEFNYLQDGNYQLFVYEDCNTCPSGKNAIIMDVVISEKKSTIDVGVINILD